MGDETLVDEKTMHGTPRRRTVMKAAAWSVPVIAVAAATPAAAASTVEGPDLDLRGLSMGSTFTFYSEDGQTQYMAAEPSSFIIMNQGTVAAPLGAIVQVTYDNRIHTPTAMGYRFLDNGQEVEPLDFVVDSVDGDKSTLSFVIPEQIPVNTSYDHALIVDIDFATDVEPPNDRYDDYVPQLYTVSADGDIDESNNVLGPYSATVVEP